MLSGIFIIIIIIFFMYVCVEVVRFILLFLLSCLGLCVCIFCIVWVGVLRGICSLSFLGVFGCSDRGFVGFCGVYLFCSCLHFL